VTSVLKYLDYRAFLRDFYQDQKASNAFFSYRYMGKRLNMHASYLVRLLQEKVHLASSRIPLVISLFGLNTKEAEYFENLVHFGKAKSDSEAKRYFEKLMALSGMKSKRIEKFQYEFFNKWHYTAIRSLIGFMPFEGDYKMLAGRLSPPVTITEAKQAVALLEKLKLIKKENSGRYILCDSHISTGQKFHSLAVRNYQKEMIALAGESLERHKKEQRHITTLTMSMNKEALEDIREMSIEFYQAVKKRIDRIEDQESVYQLNLQIFPLSQNIKGGE
jgi:uncharacterized protein (TIGR02147 family)